VTSSEWDQSQECIQRAFQKEMLEANWLLLSGSSGGRTQLEPIARRLRSAARLVAAPRRVAAAMIEQQKRKGPELPLVPVKRPRHELLLGAAGAGPGAGPQQATPGALLQAVSGESSRLWPSAPLPTDDVASEGTERQ
jgi:hypothetical protein